MPGFELDRLRDYDEATVLDEIRRVADLVDSPALTAREFDRHAKVSASHLRRRFGSWRQALEAASLGHRYSGRTVSPKMRNQVALAMTDGELLGPKKGIGPRG